jgi:hypothetical protein
MKLQCTEQFLETATAICAGGAEESDQQFVPALIHDAKQAHALQKGLRELIQRWRDIAMDIDASEDDELLESAANQVAAVLNGL